MLAVLQGRFAEAREVAQHAYRIAERAQIANAFPAYGTQMLGLCLEAGGLEQVEPATRQLIERFPAVTAYRAGRLLTLSRLNREAEARAEFEDLAGGSLLHLTRDDNWLTTVTSLAEVAAYLDDRARCAVLYDVLRPYAALTVVVNAAVLCMGAVTHYLGLLAMTLERWDAADEHFQRASQVHHQLEARPWQARTHYAYAAMLLRRGTAEDQVRARRLLDAALAVAGELGMVYLANGIGMLQRYAGRRVMTRATEDASMSPPLPAGLTPREVEVLRLVAAGHSNREIATALVLSVRTVDHHAAAIYAKIGARGRAAAIAFALRHGLVDSHDQAPR